MTVVSVNGVVNPLPPVVVKPKAPTEPVLIFLTMMVGSSELVNVQVVVLPASTVMPVMFETLSVPVVVVPSASLQTALVRSQPLGTVSPTA